MHFSVLGPVRARRGAVSLDLGPAQQHAMLALLLARAGQAVGIEDFTALLWEQGPPRSGVNLIHRYVGVLRRLFEPELPTRATGRWLLRDDTGYRLDVDPRSLDLLHFRDLAERGRLATGRGDPAAGAALLVEALNLWQGPCAAGVEPGARASSLFAAIDQERSSVAVEAADAALAAGSASAREVLAALRSAAAEDPLNEPLQAQLMLVLGRAGRQAEALGVYRAVRGRLSTDLGVEPGPALQEAHLKVLRQDDEPSGTPAPDEADLLVVRPAQLPADLRTFAGRQAELARLARLRAAVPAVPAVPAVSAVPAVPIMTGSSIIAIDGMPGTGKTTLAVHWAHHLARLYPDGQLYVNLRGFDPSGSKLSPTEALRGFLDALGVPAPRIPEGLDAQSALFRSLLRGKRVLVLLDNARDAEHVRSLLPRAASCLAIVTSRRQLTDLVADHGGHLLTLDPLTAADARETLSRRLGPARLDGASAAVDEIIEQCSGLPIALAIVAARAVAYPHFPLGAIAAELQESDRGLDAFPHDNTSMDVRSVFSWSYRTLSPAGAQLFRLLPLHEGPDLSLPLAASLARESTEQARELLAELSRNNLIVEDQPGRYLFHDLIRAYAIELGAEQDPRPDTDQALGRLLDHYLHSAHVAHLLLRPHRAPIPPPPARAGVSVEHLDDYDQAMAWFTRHHRVLSGAVTSCAERGLSAYAWRLALPLQPFYQRSGQLQDWVSTATTALEAALAADDLPGQAHSHRSLAGALYELNRYDEAHLHLRRTRELFTELGYSTDQAYVLSNLGSVLGRQGHYDEAIKHHWQAIPLYRSAGHRSGEAYSISAIGWCEGRLDNHRQAITLGRQAMATYQQLNDRDGEADSWTVLGYSFHRLGEHREAAACYQRAIDLYRDIGHRANEAEFLMHQGDSWQAAGEADAARKAWLDAVAILESLQLPLAAAARERLGRGRPVRPAPTA